MAETFTVECESSQPYPIIRIKGYCNAEAGQEIIKTVEGTLRTGKVRLVMDFSTCDLINSPGIAAIMEVTFRIKDDFRGDIVISGLDPMKESLLRMAGVFPVAQTAKDVPEALARFAPK